MAWLATATGIVTSETKYIERAWSVGGLPSTIYKREVTRTTTEYRGLTDAGATSQLTTSAAKDGIQSARKDRADNSGQYVVTEELETYAAWEVDNDFVFAEAQ
jgi:hypothetical protein